MNEVFMNKFLIGLLALSSISSFASETTCKVTSKAKLVGEYYVCIDHECGPNTASAELERSYTLSINDIKNEDEIRINFENTAKDWKILSVDPFKNDETIRTIIQYGTTNPSSDARYYINAGMARIRQDAQFKSNRDEGIPEIHLVDYGFLSTHGHKKAGGVPVEFGFSDPTTQGNFELQHSILVDCR